MHPTLRSVLLSSRAPRTIAEIFTRYSEPGFWWDINDTATIWQDSAGSTPVTAAGEPIGKIDDKSGRGLHLTQAVSGSRATYRTTSYPHADHDAADDFYSVAIDLSTVAAFTFVAAWRRDAAVGLTLCEHTAAPSTTAGSLRIGSTVSNSIYAGVRGDTADNAATYDNAGGVPVTRVTTRIVNLREAAAADELIVRTNGVVSAKTSTISAGPAGGGNLANSTTYVGARAGTSQFFNGGWNQIFGIGRLLTASELAVVERAFGTPVGITI